ncbi:MAG: mononuclear molybdenum enzyme YedY, partial [Candidatus Dechloromonas phosphoritropha]
MLIRQRPEIPPSAITPPEVYGGRRDFLRAMALGAGAAGCGLLGASHAATGERTRFESVIPGSFSVTDEKPTAYASVTEYSNFYEFGPDKDSPGRNAYRLRTRPWTVSVEGWSAVISWVGFPLNELIRRCDVTGNAKFVEFWSLADPEQ